MEREINAPCFPFLTEVLVLYDGYVFFCTNSSRQQCLSTRRYSCADKDNKPPPEIKIGAVIFLYNTEDKTLVGPFTALTMGASELDAGAWTEYVETHIPSEDLKVTWEDLHIVKNAPEQLFFLRNPKSCRLTTAQTQQALDVLRAGELYLYAREEAP